MRAPPLNRSSFTAVENSLGRFHLWLSVNEVGATTTAPNRFFNGRLTFVQAS
jgi:hypothetical protein